ncbi:hypothetical protein SBA4_4590020 [Candidatus Sulfopaludibacter sp. SbA4]|nr:hypothetical protein SBA4_4590020 [Candidatus Sulfopaludibacter sp. SbA4]
MTTDPGGQVAGEISFKPEPATGHSPSASVCEAYRDAIEIGLFRGRLRFLRRLSERRAFRPQVPTRSYQIALALRPRRKRSPEGCAVIETAPAKRLRSIMVQALWSAMLAAVNTGARGYSC